MQSNLSPEIRGGDVKLVVLLIIISLTVLTSAVPLVAVLYLCFNFSTCVVMAALWSMCVIIPMYAAYAYPDYYRTFTNGYHVR